MKKVLINSLVCWVALSGVAAGQSTQGLISGQVGPPGRKFYVMYCRVDAQGKTIDTDWAMTDERGNYAFPFRTPGTYRLRAQGEKPEDLEKGECFRESTQASELRAQSKQVSGFCAKSKKASEFRAEEKHDLALPVAGLLVVDFELQPVKELFGREIVETYEGRIVRYFGLDVQRMESTRIDTGLAGVATGGSSVSYVVDPRSIETLPFTGQDVFAALVLQPGVTADNATGRGLGLSVNGQRVASSNFLLDGVAYNDDLLTGPASQLSPESVQEYRISTNNFTAESGGASGFVANAVTRSGGNQFHGALFGRFGDERLSGRSFERRYMGAERGTDRERRIGLRLGGPVWGKRVFYSGSYEAFGTRTDGAPETYQVLSREKIEACVPGLNAQSKALLALHPRGVVTGAGGVDLSYCGSLPLNPGAADRLRLQRDMLESLVAVSSARTGNRLFTGRLDARVFRDWQIMARAVSSSAIRPEFIPSLYADFSPDLTQPSNDVALQLTAPAWHNRLVHELRFAGLSRELSWNRPAPVDIAAALPKLISPSRGLPFFQLASSPIAGNPAAYEFDHRQNSAFLSHQAVLATGNHIVSFGGEGALRNSRLFLPYLKSGVVTFADIWRFIAPDAPFIRSQSISAVSVDRESQWKRIVTNKIFDNSLASALRGLPAPNDRSKYSGGQAAAYVQDYWRIASRLTLQLGLRFERFGFPLDKGPQKGFVVPGEGRSVADQAKGATPSWETTVAKEIAATSIWETRVGIAFRLVKSGNVVLRAAYGTYSDRLFENLVQSLRNNIGIVGATAPGISSIDNQLNNGSVYNIRDLSFLWLDPSLRAPFIQNWVGGVEWRPSPFLLLTANSMGSNGSRLVTTDLLNRDASTNPGASAPDALTAALGPIAYRSSNGDSSFSALAFRASYQSGRLALQSSYTYSNAVDVQSDALRGDFFDFTRATWGGLVDQSRSFSQLPPNPFRAQFTIPLNPSMDKGKSDFHQRHNFVAYSSLAVPAVPAFGRWPLILTSGWRVAGVAGIRSGFPFTPIDVNGIRLSSIEGRTQFAPSGSWSPEVAVLNPGAFRVTKLGMSRAPGQAEEMPNLGRNALLGPGFWNCDISVSRTISVGRESHLEIRADVFNLMNHANLGRPNVVWADSPGEISPASAFGKAKFGRTGFSSNFPGSVPLSESARRVQLVVRLSF